MIDYDLQYRDVVRRIIDDGIDTPDRTGVGVRKVFDVNVKVDLHHAVEGEYILPILGLRKSFGRVFWVELFWMLSGSTDATVLQNRNVHIWDLHSSYEFRKSRGLEHLPEGSIGDGYGKQFRNFGGVDQLMNVLEGLIEDPYSRRHFISLWNPIDSNNMCLLPCHTNYNFCLTGNRLNLKFFQRSSDWLVAGNANFMFSAFFLTWVAKKLGFEVGELSHSITDCHIYHNHLEAAKIIMNREPIEHNTTFQMPDSGIDMSTKKSLHQNLDEEINYMINDSSWKIIAESMDYKHHPAIPREMLSVAM